MEVLKSVKRVFTTMIWRPILCVQSSTFKHQRLSLIRFSTIYTKFYSKWLSMLPKWPRQFRWKRAYLRDIFHAQQIAAFHSIFQNHRAPPASWFTVINCLRFGPFTASLILYFNLKTSSGYIFALNKYITK